MLHHIREITDRLAHAGARSRNLAREVTLLLVSYNYPDLLARCLETLAATRDAFPFRLLVVDNGSIPETLAILREYAMRHRWVRVLFLSENRNLVAATKVGLAEVETPYTCVIHEDMTFPNKEWLRHMMAHYGDGTVLFINQVHPVDGNRIYGFCFLIDTNTFRVIGVNDRYVLCCEDWDFMNRIVAAKGKRVLRQSRGPFVHHRSSYIRLEKEWGTTRSIEERDRETYRSIWGECRFPRHRIHGF
ncbi:MAG: Glycosyl transferase family 2 [Verrucomicrobia bacterium ADurb.Bin345]|nr:MAG: Glycosyl transferase family 2 [Verrucomicrobia bacterium ADurb.Bin345]